MRLMEMKFMERRPGLKRKKRSPQKGCSKCIHIRSVGDYGRAQCSHPAIMEIQERFPERKPGLVAATALNLMGKALALKINPLAYRNRWFNWPWCYDPSSVEACSGFTYNDYK
jgi:hypothetical protein